MEIALQCADRRGAISSSIACKASLVAEEVRLWNTPSTRVGSCPLFSRARIVFSKLGGALDALVAAGANQINGVSFSIQNDAPLLEKARAQAIADARARAETYAKAAGVSLGPILSISEGGGEAPPRPMYRMAAMAAETRIAPGEQSVTADVSVVWEIH